MDFDTWYAEEWVPHILNTGRVEGRLSMIVWVLGGLATANVAALAVVLTALIKGI